MSHKTTSVPGDETENGNFHCTDRLVKKKWFKKDEVLTECVLKLDAKTRAACESGAFAEWCVWERTAKGVRALGKKPAMVLRRVLSASGVQFAPSGLS